MLPRANGAFRNRLRSIPRRTAQGQCGCRRCLAAPLKGSAADVVVFGLLVAAMTTAGCNSILNSWLDPTTLGNFDRTSTSEIRTSLTLEDTPSGIPGAVPPSMEDLRMVVAEYPISAGDTLAVEINELPLTPERLWSKLREADKK